MGLVMFKKLLKIKHIYITIFNTNIIHFKVTTIVILQKSEY